jgi:hypothetical protein
MVSKKKLCDIKCEPMFDTDSDAYEEGDRGIPEKEDAGYEDDEQQPCEF